MFIQDKLNSEIIEVRHELKLVINALPTISPEQKPTYESRKWELASRLYNLYREQKSETIDVVCINEGCGRTERIKKGDYPRFEAMGSRCTACWLRDYWHKHQDL